MIDKKLKVLEKLWFSGQVPIGIIAGRNTEIDYWFAAIGISSGFDEEGDEKVILDWGAVIQENLARRIFPNIKGRYKDGLDYE